MLKNYFITAWRNLLRNKTSSFINIGGLAVGMAVAVLIGLWIYDELSFNKHFKNYDRIAQVMENAAYNGGTNTDWNTSPPFPGELRKLYGNEFKQVLITSRPNKMVIAAGEKSLMKTGYYFEPGVTDMLSFKMLKGTRAGLKDPSSVLLSASVAKVFFGDSDPIGKLMKINNREDVTVTGVYEDIPPNTDFSDMEFVAPWQLLEQNAVWLRKDSWDQDGFQTFVVLQDNVDMNKASAKIKDLKLNRVDAEHAKAKPVVFLFPMSKWHLYSDFENGISVGGGITYVRLYGIIGLFVLLLACINFMNLATARSEKRAREVGIRKAIGSMRTQLIKQFLSESLLVVLFAFIVSLMLVQLLLPFFNSVADKKITILWTNPWFWLLNIVFILVTGLIAGSYPAFYLSSFKPVKVLKGVFRAGRFAAVPRKILVVMQFTVSIALIIGVIVVFRQIQLGKDRPVGYNRNGLITITTPTDEIHDHMEAFRQDLERTGAVTAVAESVNRVTTLGFATNGLQWNGRQLDQNFWIGKAYISPEYGKTIGWQIVEGRDIRKGYAPDSTAMILNETVVKYMGLKKPVGTVITETMFGKTTSYTVIGVVKDMLMQSPYRPVKETVYMAENGKTYNVNVRINPAINSSVALAAIEKVFRAYAPGSPFEYRFIDTDYAGKFADEERVSKLAGFFAVLAIFISCLGLFGMASFMAEQRTKEIGVRKVLGASVFNLWQLLSKDFVILVGISLLIAVPLAYYFMNGWLENYALRTNLSWWIFAMAGCGALIITLFTVSFQAIKAALMNPVRSLRSE
ncbi:MAG TPA: ABC transporter permease [Chitinophagaceae bacterium]|nr:ABC transporter permease [Chitinophagaceae bacterium]